MYLLITLCSMIVIYIWQKVFNDFVWREIHNMKNKVFKVYFHKISDTKPKVNVFETKASSRKLALEEFRKHYGTLYTVDFFDSHKF